MRVVSVGEVLWDVFGGAEFLGGAPLNFSANLHRLGNEVILLTAVGIDQRGSRAVEQMTNLGLTTAFVQSIEDRPTGTATVTMDSSGSATFVIERPAAFDMVRADEGVLARLRTFQADWIYFGTLAQTEPCNEEFLLQLLRECPDLRRFYDMNLRSGHWNLPLVERLSRIATVLKLNDAEAALLFQLTLGSKQFDLEEFCRYWSSTYGVEIICVTLGSKGCAVYKDRSLHYVKGFPVTVADTVGAGDAFAAGFLHGLHAGWPVGETAAFANSVGAIVASGPGATPPWTLDDVVSTIAGAKRDPKRSRVV